MCLHPPLAPYLSPQATSIRTFLISSIAKPLNAPLLSSSLIQTQLSDSLFQILHSLNLISSFQGFPTSPTAVICPHSSSISLTRTPYSNSSPMVVYLVHIEITQRVPSPNPQKNPGTLHQHPLHWSNLSFNSPHLCRIHKHRLKPAYWCLH